MKNVLWILLAHYLLDYPLQNDFLAQTKGKYLYSLFAHSMIYGLGIAFVLELIGVFSIWKAIVLVVSHIVIDWLKATAKNKDKTLTSYLYVDQFLHVVIDLLMLFL